MFNRAVRMALAAGATMAIAGAVVLPGGQAPVQATVRTTVRVRGLAFSGQVFCG